MSSTFFTRQKKQVAKKVVQNSVPGQILMIQAQFCRARARIALRYMLE